MFGSLGSSLLRLIAEVILLITITISKNFSASPLVPWQENPAAQLLIDVVTFCTLTGIIQTGPICHALNNHTHRPYTNVHVFYLLIPFPVLLITLLTDDLVYSLVVGGPGLEVEAPPLWGWLLSTLLMTGKLFFPRVTLFFTISP